MSISLCATPARSNASRPDCAAAISRIVALAARRVAHRLARAENIDRLLLQIARALGRRDHQRAAAVADDAAIEQMQRRRNHARREHVLDRDRIAILRRRIHRRMQPHRHRDLGELLGRGAVVMHVALRDHRIRADRGGAEGNLVLIARVARRLRLRRRCRSRSATTPRSIRTRPRIRRTARHESPPPRAPCARRTTIRRSRSNRRSWASDSGNRRTR